MRIASTGIDRLMTGSAPAPSAMRKTGKTKTA